MKKAFVFFSQFPLDLNSGRGDVVRDDRSSKDAAASLILFPGLK